MHSAVQLTGSIVNQTDIGLVWLGFDNNLRYKIQTHPNLSINLLNINKQDFFNHIDCVCLEVLASPRSKGKVNMTMHSPGQTFRYKRVARWHSCW